jgi:hypothetical protein
MSDNYDDTEQKSPKRRFLLILGAFTFVGFVALGLMIIFWDKLRLDYPQYQKVIFGGLIIAYAFLRFSRLFRKTSE